MHITVTGSSGFIGRHLVKKLEEDGHKITVWDRNIGKDILNFEPGTSDFVIHLAATAEYVDRFENLSCIGNRTF